MPKVLQRQSEDSGKAVKVSTLQVAASGHASGGSVFEQQQ